MYCTPQNLTDRFGITEIIDLSDRENAAVIITEVLEQAIEDASAEMDGYIGTRYDLPLAIVPKVLMPIACDITRYKLYDEKPTEHVTKRYDDAIKFLRGISKGEVSLGVNDLGEQAASTDFAEMQSAGSVFSREKSKGFI